MKSLWNDSTAHEWLARAANKQEQDLYLRIYTSRLLGSDESLVLHGGGNTSVKVKETNIFGVPDEILYVKGSGWDLATIERAGFAPVRMAHLLELAKLPQLTDMQMMNELKMCRINPQAPTPSVEAILHALIPFKFVDHTHADAILAITNTADGYARIQEIYGQDTVIVSYIMPGFDLAKKVAEQYAKEANARTIGIILMNHGVFSFADTAKESYERMIALVGRAEQYLQKHVSWHLPTTPEKSKHFAGNTLTIAEIRKTMAEIGGHPVIISNLNNPLTQAFIQHPNIEAMAQQGPVTPDHVIRTKRLPMLGRDVSKYCQQYTDYFTKHAASAKEKKTMLDPLPRVILDPEIGCYTVGKTAKEVMICADIYLQTMKTILRAESLGGYQSLDSADIFNVEYWDLEQAKIQKSASPPLFAGEIVVVTGAAAGIGKACVRAFLQRGAAVVGLDINNEVVELENRSDYLGIRCDITEEGEVIQAIQDTIKRFGGLDMLVLNAGIFPKSKKIVDLSRDELRQVMYVNMEANLTFMRECYPVLKLAPRGGRIVIIGSKNVTAPGPGAGAYSIAKAAVNQLMRVAALEWGKDNIRINTIHPNAVFDTKLWTKELLESRASNYGISVEEYKRKNILGVEVTSCDVSELAAELCGPYYAKMTGNQLYVDGGNERII